MVQRIILEKLDYYGPLRFRELVKTFGDYKKFKGRVHNASESLLKRGYIEALGGKMYHITNGGKAYITGYNRRIGNMNTVIHKDNYMSVQLIRNKELIDLKSEATKIEDNQVKRVVLSLLEYLQKLNKN